MVCPFNPPLSQKTRQTGSNLPLGFLEFEFSHSLGQKRSFKGLTIVHMLAVPNLCHFNWRFNNSNQGEKRSEWPFNSGGILGLLL